MNKKSNSLGNKILGLWDLFQALPFGRKQMWVFTVLGFLFLFFPWFHEGVGYSTVFEKISGGGVVITLHLTLLLILLIREAFFYKAYCFSVKTQVLYFCISALGAYTVVLHTFGLSELLHYNSHSQMGFGPMLSFISFGMIFMGAFLSSDYFPKKPEKTLMDTPEKVDTSKAHFSSDRPSLFSPPHDSD